MAPEEPEEASVDMRDPTRPGQAAGFRSLSPPQTSRKKSHAAIERHKPSTLDDDCSLQSGENGFNFGFASG